MDIPIFSFHLCLLPSFPFLGYLDLICFLVIGHVQSVRFANSNKHNHQQPDCPCGDRTRYNVMIITPIGYGHRENKDNNNNHCRSHLACRFLPTIYIPHALLSSSFTQSSVKDFSSHFQVLYVSCCYAISLCTCNELYSLR